MGVTALKIHAVLGKKIKLADVFDSLHYDCGSMHFVELASSRNVFFCSLFARLNPTFIYFKPTCENPITLLRTIVV